jgi:hypothetical protein
MLPTSLKLTQRQFVGAEKFLREQARPQYCAW